MNLSALKSLKQDREKLLKDINNTITKQNTTGVEADGRFWQPSVDKEGNGYAVIRFLTQKENEPTPFVRIWNHGFKSKNGMWYIEDSLTSIQQADPVSEYNSILWNSSSDDNSPERKQVREQKRKLNYISNILVVKDSDKPENEGKVFLFKYGKKIFDKISEAMNPKFEDETAINPFDFWEGADFKLKIRKVEGYRNYDKSEFSPVSAVANTDEEIAAIWDKVYPLQDFLDPKNFKTYAELKARLATVLDSKPSMNSASAEDVKDMPWVNKKEAKTIPSTPEKNVASSDDDELGSILDDIMGED